MSDTLEAKIARLIRRHYKAELRRLRLVGLLQDIKAGNYVTAELCRKWKVSRTTVCIMRQNHEL